MPTTRRRSPFGRFLLASLAVHAMAAAALYRADAERRIDARARRAGAPGPLVLHLVRLPAGSDAESQQTLPAVASRAPAKARSEPRPTAIPKPQSKPAPTPSPAPVATAHPEPASSAGPSQAGAAVASARSGTPSGVGAGPISGEAGDAGDLEAALALYEEELARLISAHKRYPAIARRRGIEGSVVLRLTIDATGRLAALDTPGRAPLVLAAQARSAAERAAPFPPPPNGDLRIDFVLRFDLDD